jgi:hypothetical protein
MGGASLKAGQLKRMTPSDDPQQVRQLEANFLVYLRLSDFVSQVGDEQGLTRLENWIREALKPEVSPAGQGSASLPPGLFDQAVLPNIIVIGSPSELGVDPTDAVSRIARAGAILVESSSEGSAELLNQLNSVFKNFTYHEPNQGEGPDDEPGFLWSQAVGETLPAQPPSPAPPGGGAPSDLSIYTNPPFRLNESEFARLLDRGNLPDDSVEKDD